LYRWFFLSLTLLLPLELLGQETVIPSAGRAAQIQEESQEKARQLASESPPASDNSLRNLGKLIHFVPIHFGVEGLGPGAGPAIHSRLLQETDGGHLALRLWGRLAIHEFYTAGAGLEFKTASPYNATFALEGSHSDLPQLEYYGPGPDSSIHNRTDFRREDTLFNLRAAVHTGHALAACRVGELLLNVGTGTNDKLASTQSVFGPDQAPGIAVQSNYLIPGCSAQIDLRDFPEDPHKGTFVAATFDRYFAQNQTRFSFSRPSIMAEQYIPFFNGKRVIALRARTELSFHSDNQVVPFYLQSTLGSDTDLRGFRRYRFYDENSIALTAEYRWEIATGLNMALFVDGGNVFHRPDQFSLAQMEGSAGFGLRFISQSDRKMLARLDMGFSREGFRVWLKVPELF
jgi:hypothetical protein